MFRPFAPTAFDFYKSDHRSQYPEGTEMVYSNFTPRSDRYFADYLSPAVREYWDGKVVMMGLQAVIMEYLIGLWNETFFSKPIEEVAAQFTRRMNNALGPNRIGQDHIRALHKLGYLPIEIKALPEGSNVNVKVPVFTVKNTLPEFFWVTNALETALSALMWKFMTSATIAKVYRRILTNWAKKTGSPVDFVSWQGHDFSFRGMSGFDDPMMSGAGHQLIFDGTDTVPALDLLEQCYGANSDVEMVGGSVSATEHSVTSLSILKVAREIERNGGTYKGQTIAEIWGEGHETVDIKMVAELLVVKRLITEVYPTGIFSYVSDTYDFWSVITQIAPRLKDVIMARDGKVVFRPDSGNPVNIISGYITKSLNDEAETLDAAILSNFGVEVVRYKGGFYPLDSALEVGIEELIEIGMKPLPVHEVKGAIHCLYDTFGGSRTETGHIILDPHVGLIYGDSITPDRAEASLSRLAAKGFASANVVFGIGSFTYERQTRDTFGFAMKATAAIVDGELLEIYKDPKTDAGTKKSAKGLLRVEKVGNNFVLYDRQTPEQEKQGALETVFKDGKLTKVQTLAEIRERIRNAIND